MEHEPFHILWVSSTPFVPAAVQQMALRQTTPLIQLSQAAPYYPAIQAVEYSAPDAVFVLDDFDRLAVLEFVHHARLLDSDIPIVILCREYDPSLDYKSHKLGATDCVPLLAVDAQFVQELMMNRQPVARSAGPQQSKRKAMIRKSFFQIPVLFK